VPGRYTLDAAGALAEGHLRDVTSGGQQVVVHAERFGSLSGTLHSAAGAALSEFVVSYARENGDTQGEVSGARGRWSLPALPAGTYQLSARAAEGAASRVLQLPGGGNVSVALIVSEERALVEPLHGSDETPPLEAQSAPASVNRAD
jgi:hypothetical protein